MSKIHDDEQHTKDLQVLKWVLGSLWRAEKKKRYLEQRLRRIADERDSPIGGQGYSPLPRSSGKISDGAASIIIRLSEMEERVYSQKKAIDKALNLVMSILEYLPEDSIEREIMERHHIDFMRWKDISKEIPMSRSQVNRKYNAGREKLLQYKRIQKIVRENEDAYEEWRNSKTS